MHLPSIVLKCGPLVGMSCLKYELNNSFFKRSAHIVCNFSNICHTLAYRHKQRALFALLSNATVHSAPSVTNHCTIQVCTKFSLEPAVDVYVVISAVGVLITSDVEDASEVDQRTASSGQNDAADAPEDDSSTAAVTVRVTAVTTAATRQIPRPLSRSATTNSGCSLVTATPLCHTTVTKMFGDFSSEIAIKLFSKWRPSNILNFLNVVFWSCDVLECDSALSYKISR